MSNKMEKLSDKRRQERDTWQDLTDRGLNGGLAAPAGFSIVGGKLKRIY